MGKRSASNGPLSPSAKKGKTAPSEPEEVVVRTDSHGVEGVFRNGLFTDEVLKEYSLQYKYSEPYHHGVIHSLISDELLISVKSEILENLVFSPKETDIYRIHQSGDLANISGLPPQLAQKLPSLRSLRDALYSKTFREYLCALTGCGKLSGVKTDMAINVYTPGCHLLTHDDVIGSRRLSYILYLCGSPTEPWDPSWGGALRLYPTTIAADGETKTPVAEWSCVIPPAWNQLSFFEVVPGESFHDVEEVYDPTSPDSKQRTRMAISGWYHIPQQGEDGYFEGLEEKLAAKSSLASLQSKNEGFDRPHSTPVEYVDSGSKLIGKGTEAGKGKGKEIANPEEEEEEMFTAEEIDFLLKYIHPTYMTPDTLEQMQEAFAEESSIQISSFLRNKFEARVRQYITSRDSSSATTASPEQSWKVAVPPHKQKFLYLESASSPGNDIEEPDNPLKELIEVLLPSNEFRKLLQIATGTKIRSRNGILARRFRRGLDYTLATSTSGSGLQLEICLSLTPTDGWEPSSTSGTKMHKVKGKKVDKFDDSTRSVGGYEMYMSTPDDDNNDPAVYNSKTEDEDDAVLFTNTPAWNLLSVVLRDAGVLRFVKYVSASAKGDRWDCVGEFSVEDDDNDGNNDNHVKMIGLIEGEEEEWRGCSP